MKRSIRAAALSLNVVLAVSFAASRASAAAPFVPGTGEFLADCCDDFEDPNWSFRYNHPKSSHEQDKKQRSPGGMSPSQSTTSCHVFACWTGTSRDQPGPAGGSVVASATR